MLRDYYRNNISQESLYLRCSSMASFSDLFGNSW